MAYTIEQARKIYAMGLVPAHNAGFDPWLALETIQNAAQAERDAKAEERKTRLTVGMVVSDGRLGKVISIDGNRVMLQSYLAKRSAHIGDLTDWSFRAEKAGA
ncbi:hypothetical protein [Rhizobium mesoamericanum]|uniref:Uncharacterized protein n=1 Tax=Rhizobium mesoamericanum STM3625 TaxID=1211777 RepID=K0PTD8_9HYPH|nr:hypothetical protein [Rhizobium mesoamericanum]CCM77098.1 hypothetical protein BN77_4144 [Rhizobium mesoamericanum STM3625]